MLNEPIVVQAHDRHAAAVSYALRGELAATAGDAGSIRLWMVPTWQPAAVLTGHESGVNALAVSRDGETLLSGSADGTARLWSLVPPERSLMCIQDHGKAVADVALSGDASLVATASHDGSVSLRRVGGEEEPARFRPEVEGMVSVCFSPDGRYLVGGGLGESLYVWSVRERRESAKVGGHDGAVSSVAFGPDGGIVAVADVGSLYVRSFPELDPVWRVELPGEGVYPLAVAPNGETVAVGGDHRLWMIDLETGALVDEAELDPEGVYGADFAPDMTHVAAACADGSVRVYPLDPPM